MLFKESQNIFQLYHSKNHQKSVANWCDSCSIKEPQPKTQNKLRTRKEKISIKQFQSCSLKHRHTNSKTSQPFSSNLTEIVKPQPQTPTAEIFPKFQFTYTNNRHQNYQPSNVISESLSNPYLSPNSKTLRQATQNNEEDIANKLQRNSECTEELIIDDDLKKTKKKGSQKPIIENDKLLSIPNMTRFRQQDLWGIGTPKRQSKLANRANGLLKSQQIFCKSKMAVFERGNLFKSVKRSQTIQNDYKSDSEQSQVLDDYKSLMSKIQEHRLEQEQFQQI